MGALGIGLSLALRQRRGVAGFDFSGGALPPGASLARASAATCWSAAGLLVSVPANAARFDHDPVTRKPRGLLIEGAQTNALLRSGELGSAPWSAVGATLTGGQASPDGGAAAMQVSDGGGSFGQITQGIAATGGAVCLSAYVRKDSVGKASRFVMLRMGGTIDLGLDTATGEVADIRNLASACGVEDCGAWWRPWIATATSVNAATLYPALGAGEMTLGSMSPTTTGSTVLFGVQLEAGLRPSSYVASGAAPGARAADALTLDWGMHGVADGGVIVRYRFDDGSTQDVATEVAGGMAAVPGLDRRRILGARIA